MMNPWQPVPWPVLVMRMDVTNCSNPADRGGAKNVLRPFLSWHGVRVPKPWNFCKVGPNRVI